jgi:hypothetical protein
MREIVKDFRGEFGEIKPTGDLKKLEIRLRQEFN